MREVFELIFVTVFAGVSSDISGLVSGSAGGLGISGGTKGLRTPVRAQPQHRSEYRSADEQHFDCFGHFQSWPPYRAERTCQKRLRRRWVIKCEARVERCAEPLLIR